MNTLHSTRELMNGIVRVHTRYVSQYRLIKVMLSMHVFALAYRWYLVEYGCAGSGGGGFGESPVHSDQGHSHCLTRVTS